MRSREVATRRSPNSRSLGGIQCPRHVTIELCGACERLCRSLTAQHGLADVAACNTTACIRLCVAAKVVIIIIFVVHFIF